MQQKYSLRFYGEWKVVTDQLAEHLNVIDRTVDNTGRLLEMDEGDPWDEVAHILREINFLIFAYASLANLGWPYHICWLVLIYTMDFNLPEIIILLLAWFFVTKLVSSRDPNNLAAMKLKRMGDGLRLLYRQRNMNDGSSVQVC